MKKQIPLKWSFIIEDRTKAGRNTIGEILGIKKYNFDNKAILIEEPSKDMENRGNSVILFIP